VKFNVDIPILERLKEDPEQTKKIKKLEQELFDQKRLVETLKRHMAEMKEEHKVREEAQAKRSEVMEKPWRNNQKTSRL